MGFDGESDQVLVIFLDEVQFLVRVCMCNYFLCKIFIEDINKCLLLLVDIWLFEGYLEKLIFNSFIFDKFFSCCFCCVSLFEIGFGKLEIYIKLDKLGEGIYVIVYKGKSKFIDNFVVFKEIRLEYEEGVFCIVIWEVFLFKDFKYVNIVMLYDIIYMEKFFIFVFEYLDKDLKQYLDDCGNIINMYNVKLFLFQLFCGLVYCYWQKVLY